MKKIMSVVLALLLVSAFLTGATYNEKTQKPIRYRYDINVSSADWFDYTVLEKSELLRIPQNILDGMSDLELLYAIADYPYFGDAFAYGIDKDGLDTFAEYCSAFNELRSRDSFIESLNRYGKAVIQEYESDSNDSFNKLRAELIGDLVAFYNASHEPTRESYIYVYTPNGTPVTAILRDEIHEGEYYHYPKDQYYITTYGVTLLSAGTCIYNCHAYAWSYPSPSCPYWINNPSNYMTDGSYSQVFSGSASSYLSSYNVHVNDIIYYPNGTHSARLTGNPNSGQQLGYIQATSKWGDSGLFSHAVNNVPAAWQGTTFSIWH